MGLFHNEKKSCIFFGPEEGDPMVGGRLRLAREEVIPARNFLQVGGFYMERRFAFFFLMALMALGMVGSVLAADITLVQNGQPTATIVIAQRPTKAAQLAAYDLQYHVQKVTDAELPIVSDQTPVAGTRILIGESTATRAIGLGTSTFKRQEYLIDFRPDALIQWGGTRTTTAKTSIPILGRRGLR
jgi:hypothetical protein